MPLRRRFECPPIPTGLKSHSRLERKPCHAQALCLPCRPRQSRVTLHTAVIHKFCARDIRQTGAHHAAWLQSLSHRATSPKNCPWSVTAAKSMGRSICAEDGLITVGVGKGDDSSFRIFIGAIRVIFFGLKGRSRMSIAYECGDRRKKAVLSRS